ncbi:MAG: prephenate dehydratase [Chitinivibrionales bacterium]|nr:prephenate dehydratase [Chitinivibrionales bacterium]
MAIAFAGERGSFSELAAVEFFGGKQKPVPVQEFHNVFTAVASEEIKYGIVPIENSMAGSIHQNYDLLLENDLHIWGEVYLRVSHCLIANKGVSKKDIKTVYSHPQALAQCKKYLASMKKTEPFPVSNTARGVRKIKEEKLNDAAAIASMQAAIDYNMQILSKRIEDYKFNTTRFLILSKNYRKKIPAKDNTKTSIVFTTKDIPGALFKSLSVFALRDINLLKIESRPLQGKNFEYLFYLDFEGKSDSEAQRNAINHLQEITSFLRILGSYPTGELKHPEYRKRI